MTSIRWVRRTLPAAELGPPNPLPLFAHQQPIQGCNETKHQGLSAQERENLFEWGVDSILPYAFQDSYGRHREPTEMQLLEISNGHLTATVAPQLGGRILQLWDATRQRDLVFCNPVFQPANLGAVNAWFSGGIEWNGLIPGHSPFTCAPVFAGTVNSRRGPVLRLYEFDRVVEACWQIDLFMSTGDDRLFVHGRIVNPDPWIKRLYWWTNIAIPATKGMRVLSPADYSLEHVLPGNQLVRKNFPDLTRFDGSYPEYWKEACSVFFRSERQDHPWIAAVDTQGEGLACVSSASMHGRKYFYFGSGRGGQHWMDFLSEDAKGAYIEIQSGRMPTQNQRFDLAALADHQWTHGLASIQLDSALSHQDDYQGAIAYTNTQIHARFDVAEFAEIDGFLRTVSCQPLSLCLHRGSAWGARQEKLLQRPLSVSMNFAVPEKSHSTSPWDALVESGHFGDPDALCLPADWVVSARWCQALATSAAKQGMSWLHALALGIAAQNRGDLEEAREAYSKSLQCKQTWLAWRQIALVHSDLSEQKAAYLQALTMKEAPIQLYMEVIDFLIAHNHFAAAKSLLSQQTSSAKQHERLRMAQARIAAQEEDWEQLACLLDFPFASIREGETSLHDLWCLLQKAAYRRYQDAGATDLSWHEWWARHPIPRNLDFRLYTDTSGFEPSCRGA